MTQIKAKLIALTQPTIDTRVPNAEALVAYCARVSSPSNQDQHETADRLLSYCIKNKHWSIFQMVNAVVEIEGPRDITRQFTRHSSMYTPGDPFEAPGFDISYGGVQEFSQRYSDEIQFTEREFRSQDYKNRQNSIDNLKPEVTDDLEHRTLNLMEDCDRLYDQMLSLGVAKECARVILPEGLTMSRLYVNGTLRSWLHYLSVREGNGTQKEHVLLANAIRTVLTPAFPTVFKLSGDNEVPA